MNDGLRKDRVFLSEVVMEELKRSETLYGDFASGHEGIAVIREEYLELEAEIFKEKRQDRKTTQKEAIQLCAMALKLACQIGDEDFPLY